MQRAVQLCRFLPEHGILPVVLTTTESSYEDEERKLDPSLQDFLGERIQRIEVSNPFPYSLRKLLLRMKLYSIFWYLCYPLFWELEFLWALKASTKLGGFFQRLKTETVLTTSGPFSSMVIGLIANKVFKKKWICDLRDPFTDAYAWNFPSYVHRSLIRRCELWAIKQANRIVVTSEATRERYIQLGIPSNKISVITNGFS